MNGWGQASDAATQLARRAPPQQPQGVGQASASLTSNASANTQQGNPNFGGTPTSITDGSASNALAAISQSGFVACTYNQSVANFQQDFNTDYGAILTVDGKYGSATQQALQQILSTSTLPTVALCGTSPAAVVPPTPNVPTPQPLTYVAPSSGYSNTGLILGGLAVAALAIGGIVYATKKHPTAAMAPVAPGRAYRPARARRANVRRRRR